MALPIIITTRSGLAGHNPPHKSNAGNYYGVFSDNTGTIPIDVFKASVPADGFTLTDGAGAPTSAPDACLASVSDGVYIHVVSLDSSSLLLEYHRFNMSTDSWDQVDITVADLSGMSAPSSAALWCSIALRAGVTGDEIVIAASGLVDAVMGADYQRVDLWHGPDSGTPSWTGPVSISASVSNSNEYCPQLVLGTNDAVHITWRQDFSIPNNARTINSSNTLSTIVTVDGSGGDRWLGLSNLVYADNSGTARFVSLLQDYSNATNSIQFQEDGSDNASSIVVDTNVLSVAAYETSVSRAWSLATDGSDIYALFSGGGTSGVDQDLYVSVSTDFGNSWSTPAEELDAVTVNYISTAVLDSGKIAYLYDDGGTAKYNEFVFAAQAAEFGGDLSGVGTTTGALTTSIEAAGAVTGAATASGTLTFPAAEFAGDLVGAATAAASVTTTITFAASIVGAATATSSLATAISFAGDVTGTATVSASVTTSIPLATDATGLGITAGALTTAIQASGALTGTSTVTGQLQNDTALFAGGVAGVGQGSGALTTDITLAASMAGVATAAADLDTSIDLAVAVSGAASASAAISTEIPLSSAVAGQAALSGDLDTSIDLGAETVGAATVTGAISTEIRLAASATGSATTIADLEAAIGLSAGLVGAGSVAGDIDTSITLDGAVTGAASATGYLPDSLLANDAESASGATIPQFSQVQVLSPASVASASETSSAQIAHVHTLIAVGVESASETTSPALSIGSSSLLANDIESNAEASSAGLGQVHQLFAHSVGSASQVSIPGADRPASAPTPLGRIKYKSATRTSAGNSQRTKASNHGRISKAG